MKIGIIGAGSWGTALANLLGRSGAHVLLWDIDHDLLEYIKRSRENKKYLPGHKLHELIEVVGEQRNCVKDADFVITAVPAQHFRSALTAILPDMRDHAFILNVAKGIELGSLLTLSGVAKEIAPDRGYAVLSGPSHAEEVAEGMPTTVVAASEDPQIANIVQDVFISDRFRVYRQDDVIGVELGGALKNIIALGAGISDGMGYGDNTKAALMTRGITEMARLGLSLGAKQETFFGLTGIGDLIVTCTSMHSRNRRCGIMIGEGMAPKEAVARVGMIVEGIPTAEAARDLARKMNVEMPITEELCRIIDGDLSAEDALNTLMTRYKQHEREDLRDMGAGK